MHKTEYFTKIKKLLKTSLLTSLINILLLFSIHKFYLRVNKLKLEKCANRRNVRKLYISIFDVRDYIGRISRVKLHRPEFRYRSLEFSSKILMEHMRSDLPKGCMYIIMKYSSF